MTHSKLYTLTWSVIIRAGTKRNWITAYKLAVDVVGT